MVTLFWPEQMPSQSLSYLKNPLRPPRYYRRIFGPLVTGLTGFHGRMISKYKNQELTVVLRIFPNLGIVYVERAKKLTEFNRMAVDRLKDHTGGKNTLR